MADVPELKINEKNLEKIKNNETNSPGSFKIGFLSDTHNHYKELKQAIKYLNQNGPYDFIIINGDTSILGLKEEFLESKNYFETLNYPFLVSLGNHDLLSNGATIYKRLYGKTNFSFNYKGVQFIFFDSNNWESSDKAPNNDFILSNIQGAGDNIFIAHVPLDDKDRFTHDEIDYWKSLTTSYQIPIMFAGHNHNPGVSQFGNSEIITIGSPPKKTLWELHLNAGAITYKKISF